MSKDKDLQKELIDSAMLLAALKKTYVLEESDKSYDLKDSLAAHKESKDSGNIFEEELICPLCNYATHTKNALAIHKKSKQHAQNILKQDPDEVSYHDQKFIEEFLTKYTCDQCDKSFNLKKSLANHKKNKHAGILFTCDQCDYTTDTAGNMCLHEERIHYKTRAYKCTECDFSSSEAGYLKKHSEVVHPNKS